ncbi:MAG: sodium:proline symporter [Chlamydiae bacterium SM23_39]|nr:MAG: sodium:proline symporter [Chlamydiae bacterium SM23_39]
MIILNTLIFFIYLLVLTLIVILSYKKQKSDVDFVLANRSLNFWLTALSAHASDMSNWLFMGYPALIFIGGVFNAWTAIGLIIFMFLNWQFIAPKIRILTEKYNSLTLNAYFETRFNTGSIRIISSIISLIFFTFYISAGIIGFGFLVNSLFHLSYLTGITIGLFVISLYVFMGGYLTVAYIDLFQGLFLLLVITLIPFYILLKVGGLPVLSNALEIKNLTKSLFPDFSFKTISSAFLISIGWGIGYFGQPHIITKFMGIKNVKDINKAKILGISWQALSLIGATFIGLIGIILFPEGLSNPELISLEMVKKTLSPFFSAIILCAILAATTNVIAAQILVVASSLSEDFYKRIINKQASHKKVLKVSKYSVVLISLISYIFAFFKISSIYNLVLYSWSGIGASFGPLLLISLYNKKINKSAAIIGILSGALISGIWPIFSTIPPLIPSFSISLFLILLFSYIKKGEIKI